MSDDNRTRLIEKVRKHTPDQFLPEGWEDKVTGVEDQLLNVDFRRATDEGLTGNLVALHDPGTVNECVTVSEWDKGTPTVTMYRDRRKG
jgi:hypothetical protein